MDSNNSSGMAAAQAIRLIRLGSLAVLGGYTVAVCYRVGLFRKVLPAHMSAKLEQTVDAIKQRTEPLGNAKRFTLARRHLLRAYGWASTGMVTLAAGVVAFHMYPQLPVAIPVATGLVSSLLLVGIPKDLMLPASRVLCYYTAWLSAGYVAGPIGWIAQDTLLLFVLLTGCTMTGLCVPLFLTRGMVSYVVSAQVLSCALSLSLVTAPKQSKDYSPFKLVKAQPGAQIVLNGDINVLLTMQLLMNLGISVLHTLPTIYRFVSWQADDEALEKAVDPLKEAFCICAGVNYIAYCLVKSCTRKLIRHVLSEDTDDAHRSRQGTWTILGANSSSRSVNRASGLVSALVMVLWYVKAVSILQNSGDTAATLNHVRALCARWSPLGMLISSGNK